MAQNNKIFDEDFGEVMFEKLLHHELRFIETRLRLMHLKEQLGLCSYVNDCDVMQAFNAGTFENVMIVKKLD